MSFVQWGGLAFGVVVGWITYRTLHLRGRDNVGLSDIATVIGAVGGGVVTGLFKNEDMFAAYSIGLFAGFFLFLIFVNTLGKNKWTSYVEE